MTSEYIPRTTVSEKLGNISKAIVAQVGALLTLLAGLGPVLGYLPDQAGVTLAVVAAVATGVVTYLKKNTVTAQQLIDDSAALGLEVTNIRKQ